METKIDDSFRQGQFIIDEFSAPYRLDRNFLGGGDSKRRYVVCKRRMLFVREDIPSNLLTTEEKPIESFYVELNLRNNNWLVNWSYNAHKNSIGNHLDRLNESLDLLTSDYEKMMFLGDLMLQMMNIT